MYCLFREFPRSWYAAKSNISIQYQQKLLSNIMFLFYYQYIITYMLYFIINVYTLIKLFLNTVFKNLHGRKLCNAFFNFFYFNQCQWPYQIILLSLSHIQTYPHTHTHTLVFIFCLDAVYLPSAICVLCHLYYLCVVASCLSTALCLSLSLTHRPYLLLFLCCPPAIYLLCLLLSVNYLPALCFLHYLPLYYSP